MASGHSAIEALRILIPPAWENASDMEAGVRGFYERASVLMEPWDGPALIAFSDGRVAGAALE